MAKKIIQINKNPVYDFGMVATVFGADTEFYGDLNYKQSLQVNGYFEGEIVSDGFLVIGKGAMVKANVKAKSVIVSGEIHGNIEATDNIEIHENGKLYGNIRTTKLKIADGVVFEGNCEMIKPDGEIKKAAV
ncbi:MAG: polymer-forming cytoskeletal protein [Spirochaetes bacterium]|nr:polymer-forming cytoskeletal protein [Spirochaetota bacterium]MBN2770669.1 polymer-forming cytoskeletal protein [Spirochaetota bacterium]